MSSRTNAILTALFHFVVFCEATGRTFKGYTLFHVTPDNEVKLDFLSAIYNGTYDFDLDFWHAPSFVGQSVEIFVMPSMKHRLIRELNKHGIEYNVTVPDLRMAMEEELGLSPGTRRKTFRDDGSFHLTQYNSWIEIEKYLRKTADTQRHIARLDSIGKSHEGRDLWVLKLGDTRTRKYKPAIWIDAGIHAREWIAPATILYVIDILAHSNDSKHSKKQRYLDELDWYFLPVMNPDGYAYTHSKDRMWRKNRSPQACTGRRCCQGVDLNRNFGTQWGSVGASKNPCSNTYMGSKAFSEPESKAVHDFVIQHNKTIKAFLTFHSYGQLWMYPYGYKKRLYPEDMEDLRDLSISAVDALKSVHGVKFKVGTAANILYLASGASEDWAKAEAKIKYSYTVELRPSGLGGGFVISPKHITPSGEEIWAALKVVADRIIEKYNFLVGYNENMTTTELPSTTHKKASTVITTPSSTNVTTTQSILGSKNNTKVVNEVKPKENEDSDEDMKE